MFVMCTYGILPFLCLHCKCNAMRLELALETVNMNHEARTRSWLALSGLLLVKKTKCNTRVLIIYLV